MPPVYTPPHPLWHLLTRLGEAQILLPALLAACAWLAWRGGAPRLAARWLAGTALAATITTASKVAFMGYGLGSAALDFTGVSGHAMFAAAVLPPLLRLADHGPARRWGGPGVLLGVVLALAVAVSRVRVGAHSASEVVIGCALGLAVSLGALASSPGPQGRPWRGVALLLLAWGALTVQAAPPSRTHDWVTRLSLAVSGRTVPYRRWELHHPRPPQRRPATSPVTSPATAAG